MPSTRKRKAPSSSIEDAKSSSAATASSAVASSEAASTTKKKLTKAEREKRAMEAKLKAKQWAEKRKLQKANASAASASASTSKKSSSTTTSTPKTKTKSTSSKTSSSAAKGDIKEENKKIESTSKTIRKSSRRSSVMMAKPSPTTSISTSSTRSKSTRKKRVQKQNTNNDNNDDDNEMNDMEVKKEEEENDEEEEMESQPPKAKRARYDSSNNNTSNDNEEEEDVKMTSAAAANENTTATVGAVTTPAALMQPPSTATSTLQSQPAVHVVQQQPHHHQQQQPLPTNIPIPIQMQSPMQMGGMQMGAMQMQQQIPYSSYPMMTNPTTNTNMNMSMNMNTPQQFIPQPTSTSLQPPSSFVSQQQAFQQVYPIQQQQHQQLQSPIPVHNDNKTSSTIPNTTTNATSNTTTTKEEENVKVHYETQEKEQEEQQQQNGDENINDTAMEKDVTTKQDEQKQQHPITFLLSKIKKLGFYTMIIFINGFILYTILSYIMTSSIEGINDENNNNNSLFPSSSSSMLSNDSSSSSTKTPCFRNYGYETIEKREKIKLITTKEEEDGNNNNHNNNHDPEYITYIEDEIIHPNGHAYCDEIRNELLLASASSSTRDDEYKKNIDDRIEILDCPLYGRCFNGKLYDCQTDFEEKDKDTNKDDNDNINNENDGRNNELLSSLYVPSKNGMECVLSSQAVEYMLAIHSKIIDLTIDYMCHHHGAGNVVNKCQYKIFSMDDEANDNGGSSSKNENVIDVNSTLKNVDAGNGSIGGRSSSSTGTVMFHLENVSDAIDLQKETIHHLVDEMDVGESKLLIHVEKSQSNNNHKEDGNGNVVLDGSSVTEWIGLSKEYIENELPVPTSCWVRLLAWDVFKVILKALFSCMCYILKLSWDVTCSYPLPTFCTVTLAYITHWIKTKRATIQTLRRRVVEIQNVVYGKLTSDYNADEGCAVLHLRDDLIHELYPTDAGGIDRQYFMETVWPRVCMAVRRDNRVRKTRKTVRGKSLEWWEWVAGGSATREMTLDRRIGSKISRKRKMDKIGKGVHEKEE